MGDYHRRVVQVVDFFLRKQHKQLYLEMPPDVQEFLMAVRQHEVKVAVQESRWCVELMRVLRRMELECEHKNLVDPQVLDVVLPKNKVVVSAVGPYAYYMNSTQRTAYSKFHQRLLEMD